MKRIPITAARQIAEAYGYDQIVIYARKVGEAPDPFGEHLTTYGVTKEHCSVAARISETLQRFMGWKPATKEIGLPPEKWSSLRYGFAPCGGCCHGTEEAHG